MKTVIFVIINNDKIHDKNIIIIIDIAHHKINFNSSNWSTSYNNCYKIQFIIIAI